jgi:hypothetical protein
MCQHHCPVAHVAAEFPQLCEAETEMIGRLLGTHVQRLATIAHGDGVCTTHIPRPRPSDDTSTTPQPPREAVDMTSTAHPELEGIGTLRVRLARLRRRRRHAKRGLSEEVVRDISALKDEPEWMLRPG